MPRGALAAAALTVAALGTATLFAVSPAPAAPSCHVPLAAPDLPNPACTPGDVLPGVTAADVCVPGYAGRVRHVPDSLRQRVLTSYGVPHFGGAAGEVDHLVSLELGGSNDAKNLWPQRWGTLDNPDDWGAHRKDSLENALHALVCAGTLPLNEAQAAIAGDWIAAYRHFVTSAHDPGPMPLPTPPTP